METTTQTRTKELFDELAGGSLHAQSPIAWLLEQQGDLGQNWLGAAQQPWEALKAGVSGTGSPAEWLFEKLGVEMPRREPVSFDQQMLDAVTATAMPGIAKLPEGFYHNVLKQLDQAATGQLGKQQLGQTPRGGALFSALEKQGVKGEELQAVSSLRGSPERVSPAVVKELATERLPKLEKKVLKSTDLSMQDIESRNVSRWEQYSIPGYEPGSYKENLWYYDPSKTGRPEGGTRPGIVINSFQDLVARAESLSEYDIRNLSPQARAAHNLIRIGQYERAADQSNKQIYDEIASVFNEKQSPSPAYQEKEAHFGGELGKNLLMWSRTNERKLASGEQVAHLEEVQSGWHSKGSKEGYGAITEDDLSKLGYSISKNYDRYVLHKDEDGLIIPVTTGATKQEVMDYVIPYIKQKVPDAPLKTDWYKPLARDLVREAAEKGLDGVSWTTSKTQCERWKDPDPVRMKKAREFYERLYDKELVKFFKSEYGVEPIKKPSVIQKTGIDEDTLIYPTPGSREMVDAVRRIERLMEDNPTMTLWEAQRAILPTGPKKFNIETTDVWYIPLTPAVRQRVLTEGQKLSKNEREEQNRFA